MKIAHVITDLEMGGAEIVLCRLLRGMDRLEFNPAVVTLMGRGPLVEEVRAMGIPVCEAGMRRGRPSLAALAKVARWLRRWKPDVVQGWMCHGNWAALAAKWAVRPGPRLFWAIHHSFASFATQKPATAALICGAAPFSRSAEKVVFVSEASRRHHERIGFSRERGCVIPNGIDTALFAPSAEHRVSVRRELGCAAGAPLVGLMGRFHPQKDHANFCRAAGVVCRAFPEAHLVMAGHGVSGENATLARLLEENGLRGRVSLLGERRDMPRLVASLDLAVSSSSSEALSLSLLEAMACGVPCVATDVGDSALLVRGVGAVVPPGDGAALAEAMRCLLSQPQTERRATGLKARERVLEHYSFAGMIRRYEALYRGKGGG